VLYSSYSKGWKIADFGFSSEGSSRNVNVSEALRGTPSYRAPELLRDNVYTTKVDIWAVGCILYEIVTQQKAFENDWRVAQCYAESKSLLKIPPTHYGQSSQFFTTVIHETLHWEWERRPSAQILHSEFLTFNSSLLQLSADNLAAPSSSRISDALVLPTFDTLSSRLETIWGTTSEKNRSPFPIPLPVVMVLFTEPQPPTVPNKDYDPHVNSLSHRSKGPLKHMPSEIKPRKTPVVIK